MIVIFIVVVVVDLTSHSPLYNSKLVALVGQSLVNHKSDLNIHDM